VAPRARTQSLDLDGRSFLHSYVWQEDEGFGVLELIMTAPVVVASWIALQYYGSTMAPATFGAGDKLLHNVVGGIGVFDGAILLGLAPHLGTAEVVGALFADRRYGHVFVYHNGAESYYAARGFRGGREVVEQIRVFTPWVRRAPVSWMAWT